MRFNKFTERAQDAAARAYQIVQRYGHTQVDTEHLLAALLEQDDGAVPQILDRLSIDVTAMQQRVERGDFATVADFRAAMQAAIEADAAGDP